MSFLIDTNVVSELRKGERADSRVRAWYEGLEEGDVFLSVLTVGEIRTGIERIRRRDEEQARVLDAWVHRLVAEHSERLLPVDQEVAEAWGQLNAPDPLPVIDGLLAATALVHGLTLATRNVTDVERTGVDVLDPFAPSGGESG